MDVTGKIAQARAASSQNRQQMFDSVTGVQPTQINPGQPVTVPSNPPLSQSKMNEEEGLAELEKILNQVESYAGSAAQKEALRPAIETTAEKAPVLESKAEIEVAAPETAPLAPESQVEAAKEAEQSEEAAEREKIQELEQSLQAMAEKAKVERAGKTDPGQSKIQDQNVATRDNNVIITLPLSKSQEELAIKMPFNTSLRWLAELSKKLQKRFLGRTVYPEEIQK